MDAALGPQVSKFERWLMAHLPFCEPTDGVIYAGSDIRCIQGAAAKLGHLSGLA